MPQQVYVNPDIGSDRASGEASAPYQTLTHALQQATPGTHIHISSGHYTAERERFPITIPAEITVDGSTGDRGESTIIAGGGAYDSPTLGPQTVTVVLAQAAQLRGVTLINPMVKGTGIWVESEATAIAHCTITHCGREGMVVAGHANPAILNCVFRSHGVAGLTLVGFARADIQRSLFQANDLGVVIGDDGAAWITTSELSDNRIGMVLSGRARPVLRQTWIVRNREDGLTLLGHALPDLGHPQDPAGNGWQNNGGFDLRNQTGRAIASVGNDLNPARVWGAVDFIANQVA